MSSIDWGTKDYSGGNTILTLTEGAKKNGILGFNWTVGMQGTLDRCNIKYYNPGGVDTKL